MNPDLEKWIGEASKGLEPLAREKITEQITEHYEDSVASYRSSGLSEVDARSRAMVDLGNAKSAQRNYQRYFLSKNQHRCIGDIIKSNSPNTYYYGILMPLLSLLLLFMLFFTQNLLGRVIIIFVAIVLINASSVVNFCIMKLKINKIYELGILYLSFYVVFCSILIYFSLFNIMNMSNLNTTDNSSRLLHILGSIMQVVSFISVVSTNIVLITRV